MNKKKIKVREYANEITKALPWGILLTSKTGDKAMQKRAYFPSPLFFQYPVLVSSQSDASIVAYIPKRSRQ